MGHWPNERTVDHVVPRHQGGKEVVDCCRRCNGEKAGLSLEEYRLVVMYRRGLIRKEMVSSGVLFWGERT